MKRQVNKIPKNLAECIEIFAGQTRKERFLFGLELWQEIFPARAMMARIGAFVGIMVLGAILRRMAK